MRSTFNRGQLILVVASVMLGMLLGALDQTIVGDIFPPAERGKWQGIMMAVFGLASIVGPTAGGWITDNWGWRWVFYVNMPVGVVALLVAAIALPSGGARRQHAVDYWGAVTLVAAAIPMLLAFSWAGTQYAWGSWQIASLLVFAAAMFVVARANAQPRVSGRSTCGNRDGTPGGCPNGGTVTKGNADRVSQFDDSRTGVGDLYRAAARFAE